MDRIDLRALADMVEPRRISWGESVLDLHSRDQSHHSASRPDVVIWPKGPEEVSKILMYCNQRRIPVTAWGAGSSLEGNPIPVKGGVVLDFSEMNRILEIRPSDFQADVEPGVVYQDLNEGLRHLGLFFPPDPGARATIGGMIGNNASGTRTVKFGSTKDYVLRLKVVLASGEILELGSRASKSSSGYDLLHLFVGSEGTLGIVVEATLKLVGMPPESSAIVATFPELRSAGDAVFEIMRAGLDPAALEVLSEECVDLIVSETGLEIPQGNLLFVEFLGPSISYLKEVSALAEGILRENGAISMETGIGRAKRDSLFKARHQLGEMIIRRHPGRGFMTTDVAVPMSRFPELLGFARELTREVPIPSYVFSHAGNGNIHAVLMGKRGDNEEWALIDQINEALVKKAIEMGGTSTGEHGVGIGKVKFMELEHKNSLNWMKNLKTLLDPNGILNPGKMF
jgi:D-lactate dehydrogenase (cytochrome)